MKPRFLPAVAAGFMLLLVVPSICVGATWIPEVAPPAPSVAWQAFMHPDTLLRQAEVLAVHDARRAVWACQDAAGLPRSRTAPERTLLAASSGYRTWALRLWRGRLAPCRDVLAHTVAASNDWVTSVRIVQRFYPGSEGWILSCSASEGGHGEFVYHGGGTPGSYDVESEYEPETPGGWMQYFPGTFWGDFNAAVQDLRVRAVRVPRAAFTWYSPLGQALAAGWAHNFGRYTGGKWTGSGC